jgi:leucyl-tRNA synthetase
MVVQINGKVRDTIQVVASISPAEMESLALGSEKVVRLLNGQAPKKVITVPPRLVNIVV